MKDFLGFENQRNKTHAKLYETLIKRAIGADTQVAVLVGHHLTFELGGDLETENEIPSADTLLFDHDLMGKVFGPNAISVMMHLASVPCGERDEIVRKYLELEAETPHEELDRRVFGTTNSQEIERLGVEMADGRM